MVTRSDSVGPLLLGVLVGVIALLFSFLAPDLRRDERVPPRFARLIDLCIDDQADEVLDGSDLPSDRETLGVVCGPDAPADSFRYLVMTPKGRDPLFGPRELPLARQLVDRENEPVRERLGEPGPEDFIDASGGGESAGSCTSTGLRDFEPWAYRKSSTLVDLDGDGRLDKFVAYSIGDPSDFDPPPPRLRVELATGAILDRGEEEWDRDWGWGVLGAGDVNDDGQPEVWLELSGNTAWNIGLAVFEDCQPKPVVDTNGGTAHFLWGASGNSARGVAITVECADVDGDGVDEIVETEQRLLIPEPDPFARPEGWFYVAHRLEGDRTRVVARARGPELDSRPRLLDWDEALNCDLAHLPEPSVQMDFSRDKDCDDFRYQGDAQAYFEVNGAPEDDPDELDDDRDLSACDHLPPRPALY